MVVLNVIAPLMGLPAHIHCARTSGRLCTTLESFAWSRDHPIDLLDRTAFNIEELRFPARDGVQVSRTACPFRTVW